MLLVALGWQMYDLTGSAWDLGLVGLMQFLPALLLTIPAGQLVDHTDRRKALGAALVLLALVAGMLAATSVTGHVTRTLILMLSVALGVARSLQSPAQQAILPALVPLAALPRATAMSSSALQAAVIGGPAVGGFLYAGGPATVYAVALLLLVVSIGCVAAIQHRENRRPGAPVDLASALAGFRFIASNKVVLGAVSLDLFAVLLGGATALLPIFAKDVLATGPWGLGLLRSAPAAGALLMALWLSRHPLERHIGRRMFATVAIYGVAMLVFGLSTHLLLSMLALAVSGAADMISVVIRQTLVQLETPDDMRGRVAAVNSTFIGASNQLGEFRAGAVAAGIGPAASVLVGAVGTLVVVAMWMRLFPGLARRDRMQSAHPPIANLGEAQEKGM